MIFGGVKQRQDGDGTANLRCREEIFERAGNRKMNTFISKSWDGFAVITSGNMVGNKTRDSAKWMSAILPINTPLFTPKICVPFKTKTNPMKY